MSIAGNSTRHAALMDRNYRFQRHVYDATRKYYLLGRDPMIAGLDVPADGTILEIGCGTGRNLLLVGRRYPGARLFGLDISAAMLETAAHTIDRDGLTARARLARADATGFDAMPLFGLRTFDRVYLSYALSMIPGWQRAVECGLAALAPHGSLHVVEFGQQRRLPGWFRAGLHAWLRHYHVEPISTLESELGRIAAAAQRPLTFRSLYRDYVWLAVIGPANAQS